MPDPDIFDDDENNDEPNKATPNGSVDNEKEVTDQLLSSIVNEDGTQKYNSIEDYIKAASHAQKHIKDLKSELAVERDKGNASEKLDELLKTVQESNKGSGEDENSPTMNPEDVLGIVKEYFDDSKAAETRQGNIDSVTSVFRNRYGKDASERLYGKAEDLGFTKAEINSMIANNPNAALKILGVEVKGNRSSNTIVPNGSVDTSQFRQASEEKPKSVMGSSKSGELDDAWKANKQRTLKRLGLTED